MIRIRENLPMPVNGCGEDMARSRILLSTNQLIERDVGSARTRDRFAGNAVSDPPRKWPLPP